MDTYLHLNPALCNSRSVESNIILSRDKRTRQLDYPEKLEKLHMMTI